MIQEHKMLWQIKNNYKADASGCPECSECIKFWEKMEKQGEERIAKLEDLIRQHLP